jgi:hypothetical protein
LGPVVPAAQHTGCRCRPHAPDAPLHRAHRAVAATDNPARPPPRASVPRSRPHRDPWHTPGTLGPPTALQGLLLAQPTDHTLPPAVQVPVMTAEALETVALLGAQVMRRQRDPRRIAGPLQSADEHRRSPERLSIDHSSDTKRSTVNVLVKFPPGAPSPSPSNARPSTSRIRSGPSPTTVSV